MLHLSVLAGRARALGLSLLLLVVAVPAVAAGNAAAGKAKAGACFACHGPEGKPQAGAPFPMLAGQDSDYLVAQLHNFKSGARHSDIMKGQVAKLSDKDIQDLGTYFASVSPRVGAAA